jgi:2-polyprenyl-3-methyl-5-hydroxy-6-metoxy-1,4-benzoquinol methylase
MIRYKIKKILNIGIGWIRSCYNKPSHSIRPGYFHRTKVDVFIDASNTDEWQKEVYQYSKQVLLKHGYSKVIDFGCGSGFKLMQNFANFDTLGIELEKAVGVLKTKYPDRKWEVYDDSKQYRCDVLIMSDVIEHIEDPTALLKNIEALIDFKVMIISTPARNILRASLPYGPPRNVSHFREWTLNEFHIFISRFFDVKHQFVSNKKQATQVIECTKKRVI